MLTLFFPILRHCWHNNGYGKSQCWHILGTVLPSLCHCWHNNGYGQPQCWHYFFPICVIVNTSNGYRKSQCWHILYIILPQLVPLLTQCQIGRIPMLTHIAIFCTNLLVSSWAVWLDARRERNSWEHTYMLYLSPTFGAYLVMNNLVPLFKYLYALKILNRQLWNNLSWNYSHNKYINESKL